MGQAPHPDATSHHPGSVSCACGASCLSCQAALLETTCAGSDSFLHQGAEIIRLTDETAKEAFNSSIILRRVLKMQLVQKPEVSTFIRISPTPILFTYGVGMTIFQLMKHIEGAASRVEIPTSRFEQGADSVARGAYSFKEMYRLTYKLVTISPVNAGSARENRKIVTTLYVPATMRGSA